jgi:hypothetical protein
MAPAKLLQRSGMFFFSRESYVAGEPLFEVEWKTLIGNSSGEITLTVSEEYGQQYRNCRQRFEDLSTGVPFPSFLDDTNNYFKLLYQFFNAINCAGLEAD